MEKIKLESIDTLPLNEKPAMVLNNLLQATLVNLLGHRVEAGVFAVDLSNIADPTKYNESIIPLFLGKHAIVELRDVFSGLKEVYNSDHYLIVSGIEFSYILIKVETLSKEQSDLLGHIEAGDVYHDAVECSDEDCELCDLIKNTKNEILSDLSREKDSNSTESEDNNEIASNISKERLDEITKQLGLDELPIVEEDDDILD